MARKYHPNLNNAEALKTFRLIRRAADVIFECAAIDSRIWLHDNRHVMVSVDPNQTAHGVFLEFYEGAPRRLWTPWGEWEFADFSSGTESAWKDVRMNILERLETKVHKARVSGGSGPIYAILSVDGERLQEAKLVGPDEGISPTASYCGWLALFAAS